MKLLNVGCGGQRPGEPWTNLDCLREFLKPGTPERENLDMEPNYVEWNLASQSLPFFPDFFDGILLQHVLEHFECHAAVQVLKACRQVLKPGGLLVASVPDADYFLSVYDRDTREKAVELFGESISGDWHDSQCTSFFEYALFHREHKQLFTAGSMECTLLKAGFNRTGLVNHSAVVQYYSGRLAPHHHEAYKFILPELNRLLFSLIFSAIK